MPSMESTYLLIPCNQEKFKLYGIFLLRYKWTVQMHEEVSASITLYSRSLHASLDGHKVSMNGATKRVVALSKRILHD